MDSAGLSSPGRSCTVDILVPTKPPVPRRREPVTCGLPWPRAVLRDQSHLRLADVNGRPFPFQSRVLDRWPDGSVRWLLLDWQADILDSAVYRLTMDPRAQP